MPPSTPSFSCPSADYYRLPDWSAFRNGSAFGFGTLSVMNSTMALWEWKASLGA
ncbi:unnamed protein product [Ectocarpus sp. 8 AP-2014]